MTITINITGLLTIDEKELGRILSGVQIPTPAPQPRSGLSPSKSPTRLAFSANEAAELLSVTCKTVYRLIANGKLKSTCAIRHKSIPRAEIERFLRETS